MAPKEMIFRLCSLAFVGLGFVAAVAGADKDGTDKTVIAMEELIHDIKKVEEVNGINQGMATNNPHSDEQKSENRRN